jgi:hypothetical protein
MDAYDALMLLALGIFVFSTVNAKVILPRLKRKAAGYSQFSRMALEAG